MKEYTVELISRLENKVQANSAKEAIELAKNDLLRHEGKILAETFDINNVRDKDGHELEVCEGCGADIDTKEVGT